MRHARRAMLAMIVTIAAAGTTLANEPAVRSPALSGEPASAAVEYSPLQAALSARLARLPTGGSAPERADRQALEAFYVARGYSPAWTTESGATHAALHLLAELVRAEEWGLSVSQLGLREIQGLIGSSESSQLAEIEVGLGLAALTYARHARGGRVDPAKVSESIDRKPPLRDPRVVIDELTAAVDPGAYLQGLHPRHAEFEALRQLALRLAATLAEPATEPATNTGPRARARRPAERPEAAQLRKVQASMEQWRWMPEELGDLHVIVNIPEYTMRVVKDGVVIHSERVIVGKTSTPTPVFSNALQTVVFQPNWYVPPSIKNDEIVPALERGSNVLKRRGLKVQRGGRDIDASRIDWGAVDPRNYVIYQPSGPNNALGQVKFLFPNRHDVYMHDTPSKGLFNANVRTFSHGCVRVRNPLKLAELVMSEDKGWPVGQIEALVKNGRPNNSVPLERTIPVHIAYFTAAAGTDGAATYHPDIYGHDSRIVGALKGQMLVAEARGRSKAKAEQSARSPRPSQGGSRLAVARPAPQAVGGKPARQSDRNWMRNALNAQ